jgi:PPK2 family polyphosphate:nucleotide phosphotransferase
MPNAEVSLKSKSSWLVEPHSKVKLSKIDTSSKRGLDHDSAHKMLRKHTERLSALQEVLYASEKKAVLVVLQGMDTAGKDGTISHIFSGINPEGCNVSSFKVPTPLEARHDFLWRCQLQIPPMGMIRIFNRSHYEECLSPRVHGLIDQKTTHRYLEEVNDWESMLAANGTVILKFFLHISREEQKSRLQARLDDPEKHWKFSEADLKERGFWDEYQRAYDDVLSRTSRKHAPWYVIPADHKWARNLAISDVLVETLAALKLKYPKPTIDVSTIKL